MNKCSEVKTDTRILVTENKMKMYFLNSERKSIEVVSVDGCVIKSGARCDYLVKDNNGNEFFIELKGTDINYACEQLSSTIIKLSKDAYKKSKFSFIVSSACPLTTTTIQKLKIRFKKQFNSTLTIKNKVCCMNLKSLKEFDVALL